LGTDNNGHFVIDTECTSYCARNGDPKFSAKDVPVPFVKIAGFRIERKPFDAAPAGGGLWGMHDRADCDLGGAGASSGRRRKKAIVRLDPGGRPFLAVFRGHFLGLLAQLHDHNSQFSEFTIRQHYRVGGNTIAFKARAGAAPAAKPGWAERVVSHETT